MRDTEILTNEILTKEDTRLPWRATLHSAPYEGIRPLPVCVLFGHETDGLTAAVSALADTHVRIPMLGRKHSLNVASAGAVVLYELLRKYRALRSG